MFDGYAEGGAGIELSFSYLVAKTFRSDNGDFVADTLVGFKVESELWIVTFDDYFCGFFDGLGAWVSF